MKKLLILITIILLPACSPKYHRHLVDNTYTNDSYVIYPGEDNCNMVTNNQKITK